MMVTVRTKQGAEDVAKVFNPKFPPAILMGLAEAAGCVTVQTFKRDKPFQEKVLQKFRTNQKGTGKEKTTFSWQSLSSSFQP